MINLTAKSRIYVAGHRGLVGSAVVRELQRRGCENIVTATRSELDLRNQSSVASFFSATRPEYVILGAAKVGGILANARHPADFLYDNLAIQTNVIHAAWLSGVRRLIFLGSSCIYPKFAPQPLKEDYLLTGPLEPTNEAYAIAKIAGLKLAAAYRSQYGFDVISLMPTNLYGPGDNFDLESSHVLPALIRRFHTASETGAHEVMLWGTGSPRREFLHVDDLASAIYFVLERCDEGGPLNVGTGEDIAISDLAAMVARIIGYTGAIRFDSARPDGTPRKLLDVSHLSAMGWYAGTPLEDGITSTYTWYRAHAAAPAALTCNG